jgi:hypothetical protein
LSYRSRPVNAWSIGVANHETKSNIEAFEIEGFDGFQRIENARF